MAWGCNFVLLSPGRGSVLGFEPTPSIKISSNGATDHRVQNDKDVNTRRVLEANDSLETVAAELPDMAVAVESGTPSVGEEQDIGSTEFIL